MIRVARTFLLLTALAGLLPQMGAAAVACRAGVMPAQYDGEHGRADSMKGMHGADANASSRSTAGDPCNAPTTSHECSTMAPCGGASYNVTSPIARLDRILPESPVSLTVSQPSSRTLLPELPPPRA